MRLCGNTRSILLPCRMTSHLENSKRLKLLGPLTGRTLYYSFHSQSLPRILRNFDAYSMGHGIEVRQLLLDWLVWSATAFLSLTRAKSAVAMQSGY